ncbi:NlpC/P60 family protein [Streptomyces sp. NPDC005538]|uniref:C40 family peptidase n=1 Tax=unclassified Streptomyces TaxID=2593676 RepID=UPI0033B91E4D
MPAERRTRTGGSGPTVDDRPSREEVQRRINSLYDRAETATGNYNATRAMSGGPRQRVNPRPGASRPSDPALDAVARQWFDRARAQLGPTVPAILPPSRTPGRPAEPRPERRPDPEAALALQAPPSRAVAELTAAPAVPDITTPTPELTARPVAALPPAPQTPQAPPATMLDLPPVPALEVAPAPMVQSPQLAPQAAPEPAFDPLTADLALLPYIAAPRTETAPTNATWPPPDPAWSAPETAWSTGQMPMVTDWSTGQIPVVTDWSTGQMPTVTEQPTVEPAWYTTPEPDWRPPQQEWQPTAPAAEVSYAAAPAVAPEVSYAPAPVIAPEVSFAAAPAITPEITLPTAPTMPPEIVLPSAPAMSPASATTVPVAPDAGTQSKTGIALAFARAQIGRPCLWGAAGPDAYDCSSLTQAAWKAAGVLLPRTAQEQSGAGTLVPLTDIRPGDLIFFYDSIDHVGLYTGNGLMIHAPSPGTPIREESIFYAGSAAIRGAVRPA